MLTPLALVDLEDLVDRASNCAHDISRVGDDHGALAVGRHTRILLQRGKILSQHIQRGVSQLLEREDERLEGVLEVVNLHDAGHILAQQESAED